MAIDIENDDFVASELAAAMGLDAEALFVDDGDFRSVTSRKVEYGIDKEFVVFASEEDAETAAVEYVKDQIESSPDSFSRDWLMEFVDEEALKRAVWQSIHDQDEAEVLARNSYRFYQEAERMGLDLPAEDEEGNLPDDVPQTLINEMQEQIEERGTKDPQQYLSDMMGQEEAIKWIAANIPLDDEKAAQSAVDTDGWQHFLSHNDGNSYTTTNGLVYIQVHGNVIAEDAEPGRAPSKKMEPI